MAESTPTEDDFWGQFDLEGRDTPTEDELLAPEEDFWAQFDVEYDEPVVEPEPKEPPGFLADVKSGFDIGTLGLARAGAELANEVRRGFKFDPYEYLDEDQKQSIRDANRAPTDRYVLKDIFTPEQHAKRLGDIKADPTYQHTMATSEMLGKSSREAYAESGGGLTVDVTSALTRMAPGVGLTVLARHPAPLMAVVGADVYGNALAEGREMGLDETETRARALLMTMVEAGTEMIPAKAFLGTAGKSILGNLTKSGFTEAAQEGLVEFLNIGLDRGIYEEDASFEEAIAALTSAEGWKQIGYSALVGGIAGTPLGAPGAIRASGVARREAARDDLSKRMSAAADQVRVEAEAMGVEEVEIIGMVNDAMGPFDAEGASIDAEFDESELNAQLAEEQAAEMEQIEATREPTEAEKVQLEVDAAYEAREQAARKQIADEVLEAELQRGAEEAAVETEVSEGRETMPDQPINPAMARALLEAGAKPSEVVARLESERAEQQKLAEVEQKKLAEVEEEAPLQLEDKSADFTVTPAGEVVPPGEKVPDVPQPGTPRLTRTGEPLKGPAEDPGESLSLGLTDRMKRVKGQTKNDAELTFEMNGYHITVPNPTKNPKDAKRAAVKFWQEGVLAKDPKYAKQVERGKRMARGPKDAGYVPAERVAKPLSRTVERPFVRGEEVVQPTKEAVTEAANEAATSPLNDLPDPTEGQIAAGNYKKGHVVIQGLDISIENPTGSVRSGEDAQGRKWSQKMANPYGYIRRTDSAEGVTEQTDIFLGDNLESDNVFVIDQVQQDNGNFDEHKVMVGFDGSLQAVKAYRANFQKGWKVGKVTQMSMTEFKTWVRTKGNKNVPLNAKTPRTAIPGEVETAARRQRKKIRFRERERPPAAAAELPRPTDQAQVEKAVQEMEQRLGVKVTVMGRPTAELVDTAEQMENAEGAYDPRTGEIFVFTDNIQDVNRVGEVILHEGVGHKGLRFLFESQAEFDAFIADAATLGETALQTEERIARLAESDPQTDNAAKKVYAWIRKQLRKIGITRQWTDNDIRGLLREAEAAVQRGTPLADTTLTREVEVEETGEVVTIEENAGVLLRQHDKRVGIIEQLRECVGQ